MRKLWMMSFGLVLVLAGCGGSNEMGGSATPYTQGFPPYGYGQYHENRHVNGNWGYPGYNPSNYDFSRNEKVPYSRSTTPGYKEERGRIDRRNS